MTTTIIPSRPLERFPGDTLRATTTDVTDRDGRVLRAGTRFQPGAQGWDQRAGKHYAAIRIPGEHTDRVVLEQETGDVWILAEDVTATTARVVGIYQTAAEARRLQRSQHIVRAEPRSAGRKIGDIVAVRP